MNEIHSYLVALSASQSYNHNMSNETLNIFLTLIMLLPIMLVPVVLFIDLVRTRKQDHQALFGPVATDDQ